MIERQLSNNVDFYFVYREESLKSLTKTWFEKILSKNKGRVYLRNKPNLHAKCYMNESSALVTSMNLHDYSMVNNIEYGILVIEKDDKENYKLIKDDVIELSGPMSIKADLSILKDLGF